MNLTGSQILMWLALSATWLGGFCLGYRMREFASFKAGAPSAAAQPPQVATPPNPASSTNSDNTLDDAPMPEGKPYRKDSGSGTE